MICAVDDCDRDAIARGWCKMHWKRWRTHGDPTIVLPKIAPARAPRGTCSLCKRPHYAKGYCESHYRKWRHSGDPEGIEPQYGYRTIHKAVRAKRGLPAEHQCAHCERPASEWAYNHSGRDRMRRYDTQGRVYSLNLQQYIPLCGRCHKAFDR